MPQASDTHRALMKKWFGDAISDAGPIHFLESRGYILTKGWCWEAPTKYHQPTAEEWACIDFLMCEWDFGKLTRSPYYEY